MVKRFVNICLAILGLVVLSPLFLIIAIMIKCNSKGGVFFRGERVGQYGKPFKIYKFRSMEENCEGKGSWNIGQDDPRVTKVGGMLRKSKLDEIPQLINVLKGDMNFVGPRPELQYYVDKYTEEQKAILELKPGITDWASIINSDQFKVFTEAKDSDEAYLKYIRPLKLRLQLYYAQYQSAREDMKIVILTVKKVTHRKVKLPEEIEEILERYRKDNEQ